MKQIIALASLALLPFSQVAAEGFQVNAQSTKQAGMGHVGAALKLGAESMHFNPAGLVYMNNAVELSAGVSGVFAYAKCQTGNETYKTDNTPSTPLYINAGFKIYDNLAAGIMINTPYGSSINWGNDWAGAHLVQDIALKAFNVQPTISWKIMDRLSVGAGLMMEFGNITLNRALIGPGAMTNMANSMMGPVLEKYPMFKPMVEPILTEMQRYDDASAASVSLDGKAGLRLGFNVGAMFDINDKFTVGLSYRSKVTAKVKEGDISLRYANKEHLEALLGNVNKLLQTAAAMGIPNLPENGINVPPLESGTFSAELPLPDNWNVGLTYRPTDRWTVSGEVQFVGWNAYKSLDVYFEPDAELGQYNIKAAKEYKNTRIYRIGTQFAATNRLDVRFGAYYDESPVKDEYLNPETPSMDKLGITAGLSFRPIEPLSVDFAFSYVTGFGRDGSYTDTDLLGLPRTFSGHYDAYAVMPAIGISYNF